MQKVFAKRLKNDTFSLFEDDENHLINVLRVKLNDQVICIFEEKKYLTEIIQFDPLLTRIVEVIPNDAEFNNLSLDLFQAVIKPKHMEWILAKATELQVDNIIPVMFNRSQKTNSIKLDRMQTIVYTAAKQSNRNIVPTVSETISSAEMIAAAQQYDLVVIPYENESGIHIGEALRQEVQKLQNVAEPKIAVIVGPEGGFSNTEIESLKTQPNVVLVGLSKTILRSDTASFYALSVILDFLLEQGY
ncbi:RsmE family RNA methyltransferase [Ureaplasma ceti]|uniref:Ribosomal RNA small subunit methyltransferase E n=1 Tax=Ureaplasma ceti TaxID=3119530 RepID=A0ABP9U5X3_9BACT